MHGLIHTRESRQRLIRSIRQILGALHVHPTAVGRQALFADCVPSVLPLSFNSVQRLHCSLLRQLMFSLTITSDGINISTTLGYSTFLSRCSCNIELSSLVKVEASINWYASIQ